MSQPRIIVLKSEAPSSWARPRLVLVGVTIAVVVLLGLTGKLGVSSVAHAQGDPCPAPGGCSEFDCTLFWPGEQAIWVIIQAEPRRQAPAGGENRQDILWEQNYHQFAGGPWWPRMWFKACWGPNCEYSEIMFVNQSGTPSNPASSPNIKMNLPGAVMCDGYKGHGRQAYATTPDNLCLQSVTYQWDIRDRVVNPGGGFWCFNQAYVQQANPGGWLLGREPRRGSTGDLIDCKGETHSWVVDADFTPVPCRNHLEVYLYN